MRSPTPLCAALGALAIAAGCSGTFDDPTSSDDPYSAWSLTISQPLTLDSTTVTQGTTLTATVSYTNSTRRRRSIQQLLITARPPGGTNAGGPHDDFAPALGSTTLEVGASVSLTASRAFTGSDPVGNWYAYSSYQDSSGAWHDGPDVHFTVIAPPSAGGLIVTTQLTLDQTAVTLGGTINGSVTYTNSSNAPIVVQNLVIAGRPPGGTDAGGPFDDFSPSASGVTVQPGAALTLAASRTFAATDPTGTWYAYPTYQDAAGTWYKGGADVDFTVAAGSCTPTSCAAQGKNCGSISDGCGGMLPCGSCNAPQTCGGGGVANVCGGGGGGGSLWSAAYTPAWTNFSPANVPWASVTHLMHFAVLPTSKGDGSIDAHWFTNGPSQSQAMCAAAHQHNRKCILTVGGYGYGSQFQSATATAAVRGTFESNIIAYMQSNGYDGVDLDWEDGMVASQYLALAQELRAKLNNINPKPLLTLAHECWIGVDPTMFQVVDMINVMSYGTTVSGMAAELSCYAGVPNSKIGIGMGLTAAEGVDTTAALVTAKCDYAKNNGYGGVMEWTIDDDYNTDGASMPLMSAIAPYVPAP
jgi:hypothetical protein